MASVTGAQLPARRAAGQDRWFVAGESVVVLDGASAHSPQAPDATEYVDVLQRELTQRLRRTSSGATALAEAIRATAAALSVPAGSGPSSTVVILRPDDDALELTVLGDSTAVVGHRNGEIEHVSDDRIQAIASSARHEYKDRLRQGHGYGDEHRGLLAAIQDEEQRHRNVPGGYWIAESDGTAAQEAVVHRYPRAEVAWVALATDGVQRLIDYFGIDWASLTALSAPEMNTKLARLRAWEAECDPDGKQLPRSKRHDDMTIAVWAA